MFLNKSAKSSSSRVSKGKPAILVFALILMLGVTFFAQCEKEPPVNPTQLDKDPVGSGKLLFQSKTCVLCHGADGRGQTKMGKAQKARNLRIDDFKQGDSSEQIQNTILNGIPGTAMVAFNTEVSPAEARALAAFVRSLRTKAGN